MGQSVSQSTFRIDVPSGQVIEVLGSALSKIDHAGCIEESGPA
jgi:hypothetical protein